MTFKEYLAETPAATKKVKQILTTLGVKNKFKFKTVGFNDLARDKAVFVDILDWSPSMGDSEQIKDELKKAGFVAHFVGKNIIG